MSIVKEKGTTEGRFSNIRFWLLYRIQFILRLLDNLYSPKIHTTLRTIFRVNPHSLCTTLFGFTRKMNHPSNYPRGRDYLTFHKQLFHFVITVNLCIALSRFCVFPQIPLVSITELSFTPLPMASLQKFDSRSIDPWCPSFLTQTYNDTETTMVTVKSSHLEVQFT